MATNLNKNAAQLVLDMINLDNATTLTMTDVGMDTLSTQTADAQGRNTTLRLYALPNTFYEGEVAISYKRLNYADVIKGDLVLTRITGMTRLADVITAINSKYMLQLTAADYVDVALPTFTGNPGEIKAFTLTAASGSFAFVGSVALSLKIPLISLPGILTTPALSGLKAT